MQIHFSDGSALELTLTPSPVLDLLTRIFKQLQHVTLPFRDWDNPFYVESLNQTQRQQILSEHAQRLGLQVDATQLDQQDYLNHLHKIYEKSYDGRPEWLDFHEFIHICERWSRPRYQIMHLDYREKSGPLEQPFNPAWVSESVNVVHPGDVYIRWAELGKSPYKYWETGEPDNFQRLCELSKPWVKFKPKLTVSFSDIDILADRDIAGFNKWWDQYQSAWCQHYGLQQWTVDDMHRVMLVGHIPDIAACADKLRAGVYPCKVRL